MSVIGQFAKLVTQKVFDELVKLEQENVPDGHMNP